VNYFKQTYLQLEYSESKNRVSKEPKTAPYPILKSAKMVTGISGSLDKPSYRREIWENHWYWACLDGILLYQFRKFI